MFKEISKKGKDACKFLFWFYIFAYVPVIPTFYIMSLKGLLGLSALIYMVFSMYIIFKMYTSFENNKNIKQSMVAM
jgi:hypothetical protein